MMTALSALVGLLMLAQLTPLQVLPGKKVVLLYSFVTPLTPFPDLDRREKLQARAAGFVETSIVFTLGRETDALSRASH